MGEQQLTPAVGQSTACPQCGAEIPEDKRFAKWCTACDWNVDPGDKEPVRGRFEKAQRRLAHRYGEQLHARLLAGDTASDSASRRQDRSGILARAVALAVHTVTVALAVGGVLLIVLGPGIQPFLGAILLVTAVVLRPRFGKLRPDGPVLHRADAPRLYALVDEVASSVGTQGVDVVVVDALYNASVATHGLKGRRSLHIGLALWEVLDPQERVALLGHELGHYAHGDVRHGRLVGTALQSLHHWLYFLTPVPTLYRRRTVPELAAAALISVPRSVFHAVALLLEGLALRGSQRSEYLADRAAVRVGSAAAATRMMDRLLIGNAITTALRTESVRAQARIGGAEPQGAADGLWERIAERAATVSEREYERLRRVSVLRGHSVDSTHPPTHLRRHLMEVGEPAAPTVVVDPETAAAIATELAPARIALARQVIRDQAG
ncbi:M48 family metalloprotease [Streptomyces hundungensis]|uniref:M48 family metalloprotease n=1 Tax=Streptomyces hundungensis TaxID=1077946 RepID=UPI0033E0D1EA